LVAAVLLHRRAPRQRRTHQIQIRTFPPLTSLDLTVNNQAKFRLAGKQCCQLSREGYCLFGGAMRTTILLRVWFIVSFCCIASWPSVGQTNAPAAHAGLEFIRVSQDGRHFVFSNSGLNFTPWGFNYDHDRAGRLLETYWKEEWDTVAHDFEEMKILGANTVRIHLQVSRFMKSAQEPDQESLRQLARLLRVAEGTGLHLDVTGLGCYDKKDVPPWYNDLNEAQRWDVQARFWEAVAGMCSNSPAVFCYDLMNEPLLSEDKKNRDWTPGAFGDRYYMQRLTLDFAGRSQKQIAKAWVDKLVTAVRKRDPRHLITIGEVPWALDFPGAEPLFQSKDVGRNLDFVSLHFYPRTGQVNQALKALRVYNAGKPIIIEEMFPMNCPVEDLDQFIDRSKPMAAGWISFYWGKTIAEYKQKTDSIPEAMMLGWLEYFVKKTPDILGPGAAQAARPRNQ
jgi:hypothetical protein